MVNVERLQKELEFITGNPKRWNQRVWIDHTECGTVGCLAGNTVLHEEGVKTVPGLHRTVVCYRNVLLSVQELAVNILDLDDDQQERLFGSYRTLAELWHIANDVTDGAIEIPVEYQ